MVFCVNIKYWTCSQIGENLKHQKAPAYFRLTQPLLSSKTFLAWPIIIYFQNQKTQRVSVFHMQGLAAIASLPLGCYKLHPSHVRHSINNRETYHLQN